MDTNDLTVICSGSLSDDVLINVFELLTYMSEYNQVQWKKHLVLLSVCRQWRQLALPLVCRYVGIVFGDCTLPSDSSSTTTYEEPTDNPIVTNTNLVAQMGQIKAVRQLDMLLYHYVNPIMGMEGIIAHLTQHSTVWPNVQKLGVSVKGNQQALDEQNIDEANDKSGIKQVACKMSALLPRVSKLISWTACSNILVHTYIGELANAYADQLTCLKTNRRLRMMHPQKANRLVWLDANLENSSHQDLHVNPASLHRLALRDAPLNNTWSMFDSAEEPVLEFPNLKQLLVRYCWFNKVNDYSSSREQYLQFPALEKLHIYCETPVCPVLKHGKFPKELQLLDLISSIETIDCLDMSKLPAVQLLNLTSTYGLTSAHIDPFAAINSVASHAHHVGKVRLVLSARLHVDRLNVDCVYITELTVSIFADAKLMHRLLEMCPNATDVSFYNSVVSSTPANEFAISSNGNTAVAQPVNTSVKSLSLFFVGTEKNTENAIAATKYFAARLPALDLLSVLGVPHEEISQFIAEHSDMYPHLANLQVETDHTVVIVD